MSRSWLLLSVFISSVCCLSGRGVVFFEIAALNFQTGTIYTFDMRFVQQQDLADAYETAHLVGALAVLNICNSQARGVL